VIFSDSLSTLNLIENRKPQVLVHLFSLIQEKLITLKLSHRITLQFVLGHCGIAGNEAADCAAFEAHALQYHTITPKYRQELVRCLHDTAYDYWQQTWLGNAQATGRGLFLTKVISKVGLWPWAANKNRGTETALAKLCLGHASVNAHMAPFNCWIALAAPAELTLKQLNMLIHCLLHRGAQNTLNHSLSVLNVNLSLENLLEGSPFPLETQNAIVKAVATCLNSTNELKSL
jgi:hypothetical protein